MADVVVLATTVNRAHDVLLSAVRTRDVATACAAESATNVLVVPYVAHRFLEWALRFPYVAHRFLVLCGVPALCTLAFVLAAFYLTGSYEVFRAMAGIVALRVFQMARQVLDHISATIGNGQTKKKARKVRKSLRRERERFLNGKDRHRLKYAMGLGVMDAARRRQRDKALRASVNPKAA